MALAMVVAHFLGDYVFQWNQLAKWKSESLKGVIVHCSIVMSITLVFALIVDPTWWPWALIIGFSHFTIDLVCFKLSPFFANADCRIQLFRFVTDQTAHLSIILLTLLFSKKLAFQPLATSLLGWLDQHAILITGFVLLTMPAWVVIEFTIATLVTKSQPNFANSSDKYFAILERILMVSLMLLGLLPISLLVPFPRFILESQQAELPQNKVRLGKAFASILLALLVGLTVRSV